MMQKTLAEKLQVYQAEAKAELNRILQFWMQHAIDEKNGGFIGQMNSENQRNEQAPKGGVLLARILWTFSAAYRHTYNRGYRLMADRAFAYLMRYFWDDIYGGIYWSVDAQGKPLRTRKQIYAQAFAIYGLSEYYRATHTNKALQACRDLFFWIEKHSFDAKSGGYFEAFSREGALLDDLRLSNKDRNDPKTMNTHLHILEAYTNLYRTWPDAQLAHQLKALLEIFLQHIIDRRTGHLQLFFTSNWQSTAPLVSYGHDIEASWLLPEAAEVAVNKELIESVNLVAANLVQAATEGLQPDGSLFHEWNNEQKQYDTHREWWVSAEAMVGFLRAFQVTGEAHFLEKSYHSWQFVQQHLLDQENGEWLWGVYSDYSRMQAEDKIGFWKCPYHNARACLEIINRCKAIMHAYSTENE